MKSFLQNVMHHLLVYFSHNERKKKNPEADTHTSVIPVTLKYHLGPCKYVGFLPI